MPTATPTALPTSTLIPSPTPEPTSTPLPVPTAVPVIVPTVVVQPTPTPTPVPTETPIPTATPEPTPTLVPTPTRPRVNGYLLRVNGEYVAAGQMVIPVPNGEVRVYPMTNPDGGYTRGKEVILGPILKLRGTG